jgi:outer membrane receptor for ferrienterochelin and colicins
MRDWVLLCCCLELVFTFAMGVRGQSVEEVDSTISSFYALDSVVVTAAYGATSKKEAIYQVQTISEKDIRTRGQVNLAEILQNELNLNIQIDPVLGQTAQIQGVGQENVQIMIDGVPVVGRLDGGIDLSQIPSANVERIEIIRGALSAQYGSHAAGGVINIITKRTQATDFNLDVQQQIETQHLQQTQISGGVQSKRWLFRVNGSFFRWQPAPIDSLRQFEKIPLEDGDEITQRVIPWTPKTQWGGGAMIAYRWGDHTRLEYGYQSFRETLWRYGEKRRAVFMPYALDRRFFTQRVDQRFRIESDIGSLGQINSITSWNRFNRIRDQHRFDFEADSYEEETLPLDTNRFSSVLHRTQWTFRKGKRFSGQWGGEALLDRARGDRIVDSLRAPSNEAEMVRLASWLSLRYQLTEALTIQGQIRYNYNSRYRSPIIPGLNIKWAPRENWVLRTSYARGFRAPSLKELFIEFIDVNHFIIGNPDLRAETSHNFNISGEYSFTVRAGVRSGIELTYFYNQLRHQISLAQFQPLQFTYFNIDQFKSQGFNAVFHLEKPEVFRIQIGGSFRMQTSKVLNAETVRTIPVWELRNSIQWPIPFYKALKLDVLHRYFGRQAQFFVDENEMMSEGFIGAYHLLNISFRHHFANNRFALGFGIKNALNQTQVNAVGSGGGAHAGGGNQRLVQRDRSFFVRLQYRLSADD